MGMTLVELCSSSEVTQDRSRLTCGDLTSHLSRLERALDGGHIDLRRAESQLAEPPHQARPMSSLNKSGQADRQHLPGTFQDVANTENQQKGDAETVCQLEPGNLVSSSDTERRQTRGEVAVSLCRLTCSDLAVQLDHVDRELEEKSRTVRSAAGQLQELRHQLASCQQQRCTLEQQYQDTVSTLTRERQQHAEMVRGLQEQRDSSVGQQEDLRRSEHAARLQAEQRVEQLATSLNQLKTRLNEMIHGEADRKQSQMEAEESVRQQSIQARQAEHSLLTRLKESEEAHLDVQHRLQQAEQRADEVARAADRHLQALTAELHQLQMRCETEQQASVERAADSEQQLQLLTAENEQLQQRLHQLQQESSQLCRQRDQHAEALQAQIAQFKKKARRREQAVNDAIVATRAELQSRIRAAEKAQSELEASFEQIRGQLASRESQLQNEQQHRLQLEEMLKRKNKRITQAQNELQNAVGLK